MKQFFLFLILFFSCVSSEINAKGVSEFGLATYYAHRFHNRKTASGELYRKEAFVCAHKTYPFGTMLRVVNKKNGKSVIVRVIDRGPHKKNRIVDLSYVAAEEIDMVGCGLVSVEVSVYEKPEPILKKITIPEVPRLLVHSEVKDKMSKIIDKAN